MRSLPKRIREQISYHYLGDRFVKRNKFSARSCACWNKIHAPHRSILEADLCNQLALMQKTGQIISYTTQHKIEIIVRGRHICNHYVDFLVYFSSPTNQWTEFWEAKGYPTDEWKLKRKLVEALFPEIPYVVKYEKPKYYKGGVK